MNISLLSKNFGARIISVASENIEMISVSVTRRTESRLGMSIYLYTLAVSPSLGGSQQHNETTKTMGFLLRSSSSDEGPSRVWMALLEQHSPSAPVFHNLRRFIDAISSTAPTTGLPL